MHLTQCYTTMTEQAKNAERSEDSAAVFEYGIEAMARCLLPKIQAFYAAEEGQQALAEYRAQQKKDRDGN